MQVINCATMFVNNFKVINKKNGTIWDITFTPKVGTCEQHLYLDWDNIMGYINITSSKTSENSFFEIRNKKECGIFISSLIENDLYIYNTKEYGESFHFKNFPVDLLDRKTKIMIRDSADEIDLTKIINIHIARMKNIIDICKIENLYQRGIVDYSLYSQISDIKSTIINNVIEKYASKYPGQLVFSSDIIGLGKDSKKIQYLWNVDFCEKMSDFYNFKIINLEQGREEIENEN